MAKVMVTIQADDGPPNLDAVVRQYQLSADEIDHDFGVVEIDPAERLYVILVEADVASRIHPAGGWDTEGPYSNPRIAPFDLPEPEIGSVNPPVEEE